MQHTHRDMTHRKNLHKNIIIKLIVFPLNVRWVGFLRHIQNNWNWHINRKMKPYLYILFEWTASNGGHHKMNVLTIAIWRNKKLRTDIVLLHRRLQATAPIKLVAQIKSQTNYSVWSSQDDEIGPSNLLSRNKLASAYIFSCTISCYVVNYRWNASDRDEKKREIETRRQKRQRATIIMIENQYSTSIARIDWIVAFYSHNETETRQYHKLKSFSNRSRVICLCAVVTLPARSVHTHFFGLVICICCFTLAACLSN